MTDVAPPSLDTYEVARAHPVASLILAALHEQDARTYHGQSGDMGALALNTAVQIVALLAADSTPVVPEGWVIHRHDDD